MTTLQRVRMDLGYAGCRVECKKMVRCEDYQQQQRDRHLAVIVRVYHGSLPRTSIVLRMKLRSFALLMEAAYHYLFRLYCAAAYKCYFKRTSGHRTSGLLHLSVANCHESMQPESESERSWALLPRAKVFDTLIPVLLRVHRRYTKMTLNITPGNTRCIDSIIVSFGLPYAF